MTKETHTSGGFFIALIALNSFITIFLMNYSLSYEILLIVLYFYSASIGSLFPDIDMKSSFISKRHPILAKTLGKKCRHRGFTHSLLALLILCIIFELFIIVSKQNIVILSISLGFLLGYSSHLLLDLLTAEGIELFFPSRMNFKIFIIKTGSKGEKIFNKILKFLTILLVIYNIYLILNTLFNFNILHYLFK